MKFNISKEWVLHYARLEEGLEIGAAAMPDEHAPFTSLDWSRFPIKEMFKRNWLVDFHGTLAQAKAHANTLAESFITRALPRPVLSLQRQRIRSDSQPDSYALLAWQCRVLLVAEENAPDVRYKASALTDDWFSELVHLSQFSDGPLRAEQHMRDVGIPLVIEPHLPSTHLDGAALLSERGPVVGMTLRHDRLDNFWFVLLHELIHIKKHLRKGSLEDIFDDLDVDANDIEHEADTLAGETLIAESIWETALPRFVQSKESILQFAAEQNISPAIVAGRIRREMNNYTAFSDLLGQNTVRKLFSPKTSSQ